MEVNKKSTWWQEQPPGIKVRLWTKTTDFAWFQRSPTWVEMQEPTAVLWIRWQLQEPELLQPQVQHWSHLHKKHGTLMKHWLNEQTPSGWRAVSQDSFFFVLFARTSLLCYSCLASSMSSAPCQWTTTSFLKALFPPWQWAVPPWKCPGGAWVLLTQQSRTAAGPQTLLSKPRSAAARPATRTV